MYYVDPTMDMVFKCIGMCFMLLFLSGLLYNILMIIVRFTSLLLLKRSKMKHRYTVLYGKNEFCRSINCEALGYFGCSIPGCRHTVKDLKRWLKQNKYVIITEKE